MHSLIELDHHAVVCRFDMRRQLRTKRLVVEIDVHVRQDCAFRFQPFDPVQRFGEREMTRMRPVAQRIDDPDIEILERVDGLGIEIADVRRIGQAARARSGFWPGSHAR